MSNRTGNRTEQIVNTEGGAVDAPVVEERGTYLDGNGVPRRMMPGDPIPPGWTRREDAPDEDTGNKRRRGKSKKADTPAEPDAPAGDGQDAPPAAGD